MSSTANTKGPAPVNATSRLVESREIIPFPMRAGLNGSTHSGFAALKTGDCILDVPGIPPAVWGDGEDILWAKGQALIIAGHDGTGKTTLAGNLARARLGVGDGMVLGLPVKPGDRNVLVLMMDRPMQAKANMARLFTEEDRDILRARLRVWEGPPPEDLAKKLTHPERGEMTVQTVVETMAGHDLNHLEQLERIR